MTDEQNLVYLQGQVMCCACELEAMKVANLMCHKKGHSPKYNEKDFLDLPNKYGIHHNDILEKFHR